MSKEYIILKQYILSNYKKYINFENDFTLAVSLGNILYQNIKLENTIINYNSPLCVKKILDENLGQICQGFQICYLYLLKSFNIKCRPVVVHRHTNSFSENEKEELLDIWNKKIDTLIPFCMNNEKPEEFMVRQFIEDQNHCFVEMYINNKWIIFDPTFNCLYKYKKKYINCEELYSLIKNNQNIEFDYIYETKKQRIENYYLPLKYHNLIFNCDKNSNLFNNKIQLMANNTGTNAVIKLSPYDWSNLYFNNSIYKNFTK